jgi:transcriptional regulator with XRE-family HTH domain
VRDFEKLNVGERIRAMRQERGWSAERVAKESAYLLDRTAIWKVENGKRRLKVEEAVVLAKVFGMPLEELTGSAQGPVETHNARDETVEPGSPAAESAESLPVGQLRRAEQDALIGELTDVNGPRYWLITAPPGFGKTSLLHELCAELEQEHGWATNFLDARRQAAEIRDSPAALIARLTEVALPEEDDSVSGRRAGSDMAVHDESDIYRMAAQQVSKQGKPLLCALDSADLLSRDSARSLRAALRNVSSLVEESGNPGLRLAFVVASRFDDGWLGSRIRPQPSVLKLREFDVDTVEKQLRDAAGAVRAANITAEKFRYTASLIHQITAGVPALLPPVLEWINGEQWIDIYRLGNRDVHEPITAEFITNRLLAADSLLPGDDTPSESAQAAVQKAVELLVRYRFFTQAHVKRHLESENLWSALTHTALLTRPLDEPWQAFHPAVRRLLFTYFYKADEERARAHEEASEFMAEWIAKVPGTDQVTGLIEGLWHYAEMLRFRHADRSDEQLRDRVRELREAIRPAEIYSVDELRSYAADLIMSDTELQESIGSAELAEELADMMAGQR